MGRRGRVEIDLAVQAAHPPLVLVLDERGVGPLHDDGDELVLLAPLHEGREVELRRQARVLAHADGVAVEENIEHALRAAKMDDDAPAFPVRRDAERLRVNAGGVRRGHRRRLVGKWHLDVGVVRMAVALHRPVARHRDLRPAGAVGLRRNVRLHQFLRPRGQAKAPRAVEGAEPGRLLALAGARRGRRGIRVKRRPHRQAVEGNALGGDKGPQRTDLRQQFLGHGWRTLATAAPLGHREFSHSGRRAARPVFD